MTDEKNIHIVVLIVPEKKDPPSYRTPLEIFSSMNVKSIVAAIVILSILFLAPFVTILLVTTGK